MGNMNYSRDMPINSAAATEAYDQLRYYFSQFGLGAETGIDLPSASTGVAGDRHLDGRLLDFMIGQYDTYTPLQMAQYISTIANDGYRMKARLVSEIREPSSNPEEPGAVVQKFEPTVLNRIDMSDAHISRVQQSLQRVVHGTNGTARTTFKNGLNHSVRVAAKTGTAESFTHVNGRLVEGNNQTFIAYAPADNPEIAIAVVVPHVSTSSSDTSVSQRIGADMMNLYFDLQEEREGPVEVDEQVLEDVEETID